MTSADFRVAVVGATGLVGTTIATVLEERRYPVAEYIPVATDGSSGRNVEAFGRRWPVRTTGEVDFGRVDVCFCTAGAAASRELVPGIVAGNCRVVDNTTAFRMDDDVPLVVPEINGSLIGSDTRVVSCPNCTAIVLVMALAPLLRVAGIRRVVVTSMQSVSGAGKDALAELDGVKSGVFAKPIAFNCLPLVGEIEASGNTKEEAKIIEETRKILSRPDLDVVATAVRVPVRVGHSISVNVELDGPLEPEDAKRLWAQSPGVVCDDEVPTPLEVAGEDRVRVGRVRKDPTREHALSFWAVGDNLRKGAATNSVQIAEYFRY